MLYSTSAHYFCEKQPFHCARTIEADNVEQARAKAIAQVLIEKNEKATDFSIHVVQINEEFIEHYYEKKHNFVTLEKVEREPIRDTCPYNHGWETYPVTLPSCLG